MPANAQMFSVRLPSLSTRHEGPPGPRGHASHAAGTMETSRGQRKRPEPSPLTPPQQTPHPHARLLTKTPPAKTHTHKAHPTHTHPPAEAHPQLYHHLCKPPKHTDRHANSRGHTHNHTQAQPCRKGHSGPASLIHKGALRPAPLLPWDRRALCNSQASRADSCS